MKFRKIISRVVAGLSALAVASAVSLPSKNVSARADGYYYVGNYFANVSEYLTIRKEANTWSQDLGHIPANSKFSVEYVDGYMGYVRYKIRGKEVRGYVNLRYALEDYRADGGSMVERVPSRYYSVTIRSQPNTYSYANGYLPTGAVTPRGEYSYMDRRMTSVNYWDGSRIISGWINLDYMELARCIG